jgi:hypothetical protein
MSRVRLNDTFGVFVQLAIRQSADIQPSSRVSTTPARRRMTVHTAKAKGG